MVGFGKNCICMNDPFVEEVRQKIYGIYWPATNGQENSRQCVVKLLTDYDISPKCESSDINNVKN